MLYFTAEVLLCFFAVIGFVCTVTGIIDTVSTKKAGISCTVCIDKIKNKKNAEYSIRVLEGIITKDSLYGIIDRIKVPPDTADDRDMLEKLKKEFGNIIY